MLPASLCRKFVFRALESHTSHPSGLSAQNPQGHLQLANVSASAVNLGRATGVVQRPRFFSAVAVVTHTVLTQYLENSVLERVVGLLSRFAVASTLAPPLAMLSPSLPPPRRWLPMLVESLKVTVVALPFEQYAKH